MVKIKAYIKQLGLTLDVKRFNFDVETVEVCIGEDEFLHNDLSEYDLDEVIIYQYTGFNNLRARILPLLSFAKVVR